MIEKGVYPRRLVKEGVFAVIDGNPFKIENIGVGGASFYCDDVSFFNAPKQRFEIFVMDGNIHNIKDIAHSLVSTSVKSVRGHFRKTVHHVRVLFGDLSDHQYAQFRMLLGLA